MLPSIVNPAPSRFSKYSAPPTMSHTMICPSAPPDRMAASAFRNLMHVHALTTSIPVFPAIPCASCGQCEHHQHRARDESVVPLHKKCRGEFKPKSKTKSKKRPRWRSKKSDRVETDKKDDHGME